MNVEQNCETRCEEIRQVTGGVNVLTEMHNRTDNTIRENQAQLRENTKEVFSIKTRKLLIYERS